MNTEYLKIMETVIQIYAVFFVCSWIVFFYLVIRFNVLEQNSLNKKHSIP